MYEIHLDFYVCTSNCLCVPAEYKDVNNLLFLTGFTPQMFFLGGGGNYGRKRNPIGSPQVIKYSS